MHRKAKPTLILTATLAASALAGPMAFAGDAAALESLREELVSTDRATALSRTQHFRPLCDEGGYPLVGNVYRKGPAPEIQPSAFCAEVRAGKRDPAI